MQNDAHNNIRKTQCAAKARRVEAMSAQIAMGVAHVSAQHEGLSAEHQEQLQKMLLGIWTYQNFAGSRQELPLDEIWRAGEASLQCIPGHDYAAAGRSVILVPSMINKAYVFDLSEEWSMMRWLATQGVHPYLLSWGEPVADEGQADIDAVVLERLVPAVKFLAEHVGAPVHALGYCMGGTLLVGAAGFLREDLASVSLLAAPWDFAAGSGALRDRVQFWAPSALSSLRERSSLSADMMQMIFVSLNPQMSMSKFAGFADMDQGSAEAAFFVAVEDWLNDGVDLPSALARHCIEDWFLENMPGRGEWVLGGSVVRPEAIECPIFIIASDKDNLVEYDCAAVLAEQIGSAEILNPSCGHIGMMAGRNSMQKVWEPLAEFIKTA